MSLYTKITDVLEEYVTSIFRLEYKGNMLLRNVDTDHQITTLTSVTVGEAQ
jgi:hypothetical protein